tara:strand:+ start:97 stop:714 length:618 start_codon:yes stop_codon:yes gene_type:complete
MHYIYYLHSGDNTPFYVGKTNNPNSRKYQHNRTYGSNTCLEILEEVNNETWRETEEFYIQMFRYWGFKLKNGFKGGGGASYWTDAQKNNENRRQKLSKPKPKGFGDKVKKNRNHKLAGELARKSNEKHYKKGSERNKKISAKLKGRKVDWTGTPIIQLDLENNIIQEYVSIRQAGFSLRGTPGESIRKCLKGLQKSAYGFLWRYK